MQNPRVSTDTHQAVISENSVYFEESRPTSRDILQFLDFKCIKKEPAYIDVVNQYSWGGKLKLQYQVFLSKPKHFNSLNIILKGKLLYK